MKSTHSDRIYRLQEDQESGAITFWAAAANEGRNSPAYVYTPFFRDAVLSPEVLSQYSIGLILREPTFCDATYKFSGFIAPHRYVIYSSEARCLDAYSQHPEWGLCVWMTGRHFKVVGQVTKGDRSQIALLDVSEDHFKQCSDEERADIEARIGQSAARLFERALATRPLPELDTEGWRKRLAYPIGIDDGGRPYLP
jgi:hypothetical protein